MKDKQGGVVNMHRLILKLVGQHCKTWSSYVGRNSASPSKHQLRPTAKQYWNAHTAQNKYAYCPKPQSITHLLHVTARLAAHTCTQKNELINEIHFTSTFTSMIEFKGQMPWYIV